VISGLMRIATRYKLYSMIRYLTRPGCNRLSKAGSLIYYRINGGDSV
jgi:hypothetical protein